MGSVTNLEYHVVLTTKYRKPTLIDIEQSVYQAFRKVAHYTVASTRPKL